MWLLKQNIRKNEQLDEQILELDFDVNNSKEYNINAIQDRTLYTSKAKDYL